jgi:ABC-2 type transport system permease protein
MLAQIRSELLKLATVRTSLLFVLATAALTALVVVMQAVSAGGEFMGPLADAATQEALLGSGEPVTLIAIVFGCLALTTEFRHHTIVTTLLADPLRSHVVAAKAVGAIAAGAVLALAAVLVALLGTWTVLQVTGTTFVADAGLLGRGVAGTVAAAALGSLLGMGIGGIVRNQALAVGATLLLLLAVEPLVGSLAPSIGRWMPSGLATVLASGQAVADPSLSTAALVLALYGIGAAAIAALALRRADIT